MAHSSVAFPNITAVFTGSPAGHRAVALHQSGIPRTESRENPAGDAWRNTDRRTGHTASAPLHAESGRMTFQHSSLVPFRAPVILMEFRSYSHKGAPPAQGRDDRREIREDVENVRHTATFNSRRAALRARE